MDADKIQYVCLNCGKIMPPPPKKHKTHWSTQFCSTVCVSKFLDKFKK